MPRLNFSHCVWIILEPCLIISHCVWIILEPHLITSHSVWVTLQLRLITFHIPKMSCSAKDLATVLRKLQQHAGMSFLHIQVLRKKYSQLVCTCSVLYIPNSQSTFISYHLISIWSYQLELHHLLTLSLPSLNIPKLKPVCSFHKLSLTFCKYQMSDLRRDGWYLSQAYVNRPYETYQKERYMFTAKYRTDKLHKLTTALKK